MEGLGKKFQEARLARKITLEEAGRLTKIRPNRLAEIENEDFSQFPSLAYARGFLQIYGKFLDVDVSPYLEAFETADAVSVDGYSYLQDNPAPKPMRPIVVRRPSADHGSLWLLVIGVVVIVLGFSALKFIMNIQRVNPNAAKHPTPAPTPEHIVAPRAVPVDNSTPVPRASLASTPRPTPGIASTPAPTIPTAPSVQPEVRRAEPVTTNSPSSFSGGVVTRIEIRALKKTYLKVVVDGDDMNPALERWVSPSDTTAKFNGSRIAIRVLEPNAVEIKKNGKKITTSDAEVTIE